jgi:hypothetical protein
MEAAALDWLWWKAETEIEGRAAVAARWLRASTIFQLVFATAATYID